MLQRIEVDGGLVRVHVLLTIEGCPLRDRITTDVTAAVQPLAGVERVEVTLTPMSDEQRQAPRRAAPRRPRGASPSPSKISFPPQTAIIAVASGKGGVGKSSVDGEPRMRARGRGGERRDPRCRRLGLQRAADDRRRGQARRVQRHDHAARVPRREGDLDGLLRSGGDAGDLARTDAAQGDRAVPRRRLLGRPRLPALRPPAGNRRREHLARLVHPGGLDGRRDDAAGGRAQGRRARRQDGRADQPPADRRDREHVVLRVPALRRARVRCSARAAGGSRPRRSASACSRRSPWFPRCARAATRARRSSFATRRPRRSEALREAADAVRKATKSKIGKPLSLMAR